MKKILICDDENDIREVLEMLIEVEFDVEIHHAVDGQDGIDKLSNDTVYDLIICDMNMPKLRGVDVYNHNRLTNRFPFILLSADSDRDIKEFEGFNDCKTSFSLNKPWSNGELMDKLSYFLGHAKAS